MKKSISTYILSAGLLLSSCTDLDQSSISSIDKDNFYQNESDIKVALNGIYQTLTDGGMNAPWNDELIFLNDLQSEYARRGTANSAAITEIGNFAITPNNAFVQTAWLYRYTAINRANILIDKVSDNQQLTEKVRNNYVRAAKFLRGLYYFDLVRLFGDVPLVVHDGEGEGEPRTSKDLVYEQIVADLTEAEQITATSPNSPVRLHHRLPQACSLRSISPGRKQTANTRKSISQNCTRKPLRLPIR